MLRGEFPAAYEIPQAIMFGRDFVRFPSYTRRELQVDLEDHQRRADRRCLFLSACSGDP